MKVFLSPLLFVIVLLPFALQAQSTAKSVIEILEARKDMVALTAALRHVGLDLDFEKTQAFTLFAPTDAAFEALPENALEAMMQPGNEEVLRNFLTYHIVPQIVSSEDWAPQKLKTVFGASLSIGKERGSLRVGEARLTKRDIPARNGIIHVIDTVLIPSKSTP